MALPFQPKGNLTPEQLLAARVAAGLTHRPAKSFQRAGETSREFFQRVDREMLENAAREARRDGQNAAINRGEDIGGGLKPIASGLLPQVQAVAKVGRVNHWKIHKADVPERIARETSRGAWFARITSAAKAHGHPGLSWHAIERYADEFLKAEQRDGVGFLRRTGKQFAGLTKYCVRHVTRLKTWFDAHGLFDILNVLTRDEDGRLVREGNLYVPTVDVPPAPLPADVKGDDPVPSPAVSRAFGGLARLAALTGLRETGWGLNAMRTSRRLGRAAPA